MAELLSQEEIDALLDIVDNIDDNNDIYYITNDKISTEKVKNIREEINKKYNKSIKKGELDTSKMKEYLKKTKNAKYIFDSKLSFQNKLKEIQQSYKELNNIIGVVNDYIDKYPEEFV